MFCTFVLSKEKHNREKNKKKVCKKLDKLKNS